MKTLTQNEITNPEIRLKPNLINYQLVEMEIRAMNSSEIAQLHTVEQSSDRNSQSNFPDLNSFM